MTILIVGAGPTGLTMAAELARHGVTARIIDEAVTPAPDTSRALVLQVRTLELFDLMGIVDQVAPGGLTLQGLSFVTHGGRRTPVPVDDFIASLDSPYPSPVMLPQADTERILAARATGLGVTIERGVALDSFVAAGDHVDVTLRHADGRVENTAVQWLLGCDGAHSTVRHGTGIPFNGITYRDECLLGDVHIDWSFPDGTLTLMPSTEGVLAAFPIKGPHHFRIIMILPRDDTAPDRTLSREQFETQLARMVPPSERPPVLTDVAWQTRYRLHRRGVTHYRAGRVFLAGDAAHIHSPAGGQGMNTGIQDAINLAWKLALVVRGRGPAWLLDTYESERLPVAHALLRGTDVLFAAMVSRGYGGSLIRNVAPGLGLRLLLIPAVRQRVIRFMSEIDISYPKSRLSVHAGDRAPALFELFRHPGHTALIFADLPAVAEAINRQYAGDVQAHVITDPHLRAKYGVPTGGVCLVRPDGYVGFRATSVDDRSIAALRADLARRFTA
jgi:2-polyprenyl-6-methoxyphenol hydroxylase-like FAD-dependent oxidoreductase